MSSMFSGCQSLKEVPALDTSNVTVMNNMFSGCQCLTATPSFNTVKVTNMTTMFVNCIALQTIGQLNGTAVTTLTSLFSGCSSLSALKIINFKITFSVASCKLSATALNEIYTNLPTVTGQTITVTGNYGTTSDNPAIAQAKGWTVSG
jgi:surface protein